MARRGHATVSDPEFGSDSFLDVIANIVGILIILIVIVGFRVRTAPTGPTAGKNSPTADMDGRQQEWQAKKRQIEAENDRRTRSHERALAQRREALEQQSIAERRLAAQKQAIDQQAALRRAEIERREQILRQYETEAAQLAGEVVRLQADIQGTAKRVAAREKARQDIAAATAQAAVEVKALDDAVRLQTDVLTRQQTDWSNLTTELDQLRTQVEALKRQPKPVKRWVHYATPLAQTVEKKELHYRCSQARVANVPLDALLAAMRAEVQEHDFGTKPAFGGVAGPISGFRLKYLLVRSEASLTERLNGGSSRVQLAGFEVVADDSDLGEPAETAFAAGSAFLRTMADCLAGECAVTLWVYPDSFALAKQLETYLHEKGFTVAQRPLPAGVPIAGSPWGSASRGQ